MRFAKGDDVPEEIRAVIDALCEVVVPLYAVVGGRSHGCGTGVIIGRADKEHLWGVTAAHVFLESLVPALRKRKAHPSALEEFFPADWNTPLALLSPDSAFVLYEYQSKQYRCAFKGFCADKRSDLALFLIHLPEALHAVALPAMEIDSDPLLQGARLVSAGYLWEDEGFGQRLFALTPGEKVEELRADERTGAPTYFDLTVWSDHGMSGGPVIRVGEGGNLIPKVSAIISRGIKGDPKTTAVSAKALHIMTWRQQVFGANSFEDLVSQQQVRDGGKFASTIVVYRNYSGTGIGSTRMRWRIVNSFIPPSDGLVG
jgi:hypothetical protein